MKHKSLLLLPVLLLAACGKSNNNNPVYPNYPTSGSYPTSGMPTSGYPTSGYPTTNSDPTIGVTTEQDENLFEIKDSLERYLDQINRMVYDPIQFLTKFYKSGRDGHQRETFSDAAKYYEKEQNIDGNESHFLKALDVNKMLTYNFDTQESQRSDITPQELDNYGKEIKQAVFNKVSHYVYLGIGFILDDVEMVKKELAIADHLNVVINNVNYDFAANDGFNLRANFEIIDINQELLNEGRYEMSFEKRRLDYAAISSQDNATQFFVTYNPKLLDLSTLSGKENIDDQLFVVTKALNNYIQNIRNQSFDMIEVNESNAFDRSFLNLIISSPDGYMKVRQGDEYGNLVMDQEQVALENKVALVDNLTNEIAFQDAPVSLQELKQIIRQQLNESLLSVANSVNELLTCIKDKNLEGLRPFLDVPSDAVLLEVQPEIYLNDENNFVVSSNVSYRVGNNTTMTSAGFKFDNGALQSIHGSVKITIDYKPSITLPDLPSLEEHGELNFVNNLNTFIENVNNSQYKRVKVTQNANNSIEVKSYDSEQGYNMRSITNDIYNDIEYKYLEGDQYYHIHNGQKTVDYVDFKFIEDFKNEVRNDISYILSIVFKLARDLYYSCKNNDLMKFNKVINQGLECKVESINYDIIEKEGGIILTGEFTYEKGGIMTNTFNVTFQNGKITHFETPGNTFDIVYNGSLEKPAI